MKNWRLYITRILIVALVVFGFVLLDNLTLRIFGRKLAFAIIASGFALLLIYGYISARRSTSVSRYSKLTFSEDTQPIPEQSQALHEFLLAAGFSPEAQATFPKAMPTSPERPMWVYLNSGRTIIVWLYAMPGVEFASHFEDGYEVVTIHPKGVALDLETINVNVVSTSLDAALDFHVHHCDMVSSEHGRPITITDWDVIKDKQPERAKVFRRHINLHYKNMAIGYVFISVVVFILLQFAQFYMQFILPLPTQSPNTHPITSLVALLIGVLLVLSPIGFIYYLMKRGQEIERRDTVEARKNRKREAGES